MPTIRQTGGMSGFTNRAESEYDPFGAGHSSTSISAALGMAVARDFKVRACTHACFPAVFLPTCVALSHVTARILSDLTPTDAISTSHGVAWRFPGQFSCIHHAFQGSPAAQFMIEITMYGKQVGTCSA